VRAVNDDWRLLVTLLDREHANALAGSLAASELEHDLSTRLQDRVVFSRDGSELFLYAGTREVLEGVRSMIERTAAERDWEPSFELKRWHPAAEAWEDPDVPLPSSPEEQAAERAELMERESEDAEEQGYTDFEVKVQCESRADAAELADRLEAEGLPHVRRYRYVVIGAQNEESAHQLADRLRGEVPEGSEITVEGTAGAAYAGQPANLFALFGGLGG
jgi:hypothetical protein